MIETDRCRLYNIQADDYDNIKTLYMDKNVRQYLGGIVNEQAYNLKFNDMCNSKYESFYKVIRRKEDEQFIGLVSLDIHHDGISTEVSYQLLPEWWGQGYAIEIVQEVINYAFKELGLTRIVAETQTANKKSCNLLKRIGMSLEKIVERYGEEQSIFSIRNL